MLVAAVACAGSLVPASAMAATYPIAQPTITSAFTPALITTGSTSALSITITNPATATATLAGIAITDTLPAGLVVDNPNGQNGTCGSAGVLTANPGTNQITLTGGSLAKGASCTISADVTSSAPGAYANATGPVTYTGGATPTGDTETLTVVGEPTITIASPVKNGVFKFGQKVKASYTCADPTGAPAVNGCIGDVNDGALLDTKHAGPQTFTVTATNAIGGLTTETVNYTVLPNNAVTVSAVKTRKIGKASFTVKVPGPGTVGVTATVSGYKQPFALDLPTPARTTGKPVHVQLAPTAAALKLLNAAKAAGKGGDLKLHIVVSFKPKGGRTGTHKLPAVQLAV